MRVAYLSYDGALDPLGATQVVPYLEGLASRGVDFDLITFEKPELFRNSVRRSQIADRLQASRIRWHPLRYRKSPRVPAKILDVLVGALSLRRLLRTTSFDAFHCRGEITPLMFRLSRLKGPLLLDMRGFFSDERVDAESWEAGGGLDRLVRWVERGNLARARRVVVLTERAQGILKDRGVDLPIEVIPTCVDCDRFAPSIAGPGDHFDLVYFGSLGGWYMTDEMISFVERLNGSRNAVRVLFLTNNVSDRDRTRLILAGVTVQSSMAEDVPIWLSRCRASFFFIRATPSKRASCPTKLAEALAMGLPVLTGPGIGDVDALVRRERVGVVLDDFSQGALERGWRDFTGLLAEPDIRERCRATALRFFSLTLAVDRYEMAYRELLRPAAPTDQV